MSIADALILKFEINCVIYTGQKARGVKKHGFGCSLYTIIE